MINGLRSGGLAVAAVVRPDRVDLHLQETRPNIPLAVAGLVEILLAVYMILADVPLPFVVGVALLGVYTVALGWRSRLGPRIPDVGQDTVWRSWPRPVRPEGLLCLRLEHADGDVVLHGDWPRIRGLRRLLD